MRLVLPMHSAIDRSAFSFHPVASYTVPSASGPVPVSVSGTEMDGLPVYFISGPPFEKDSPVYSIDTRLDGSKFTFFSLALLELPRQLGWKLDILHVNDWHTALAAYALDRVRSTDPFLTDTHALITVHNLPFMGSGAEWALPEYNLPPGQDNHLPEWARVLPLPLGLSSVEKIVAVSPTYAREILTPEFGCGLQDFLRTRQDAITGILNGIDTILWNPAREREGVVGFDANSLDIRGVNKETLQNRFSLNVDPNTPLLTFIGRMDPQKGVDLVFDGLRQIADLDWQAIILGTGIPGLEASARSLENDFPDRVRAVIRFDSRLSHLLYAGSDILMMPSRYEPCGLAQMIAMRYGCIPVARNTGGLSDTVRDFFRSSNSNGFLFDEATPEAFALAMRSAIRTYPNRSAWRGLQTRGGLQDFSWLRSATQYARLYNNLMGDTPV